MASPRRARSLFLSPDKAELLAAKEINNLVHRVEVIPRKPVPRQGRRTDIVVERSAGDESRMSTTSTIKTVDAFCREYRPPSVSLHRLSYLDKELPPPPPSETPNQTLSQGNAVSRRSTQKNAAAQTVISIQSRYSTRIKPSTPSRLSTISSQHISSQQRDSEDHISIRSHSSIQDIPVDQAVTRSKPRASLAINRRRPSVVGDVIKEDVRRRRSGSISPGTVPDRENNSAAAGREIQSSGRQEADTDPRGCQDIQDPFMGTDNKDVVLRSKSQHKPSVGWTFNDGLILRTDDKLKSTTGTSSGGENLALEPFTGTNSKEIVLRSKSQHKPSVGWTFNDGLILRTDDKLKSTTGTSPEGENLALEPRPKSMLPIRWTFRDGIIYKATRVPKNEDGTKSKRLLPIGWSFYDGLTIRPDGSVKAVSKASGKSVDSVHGSNSKRMIPIGWTFHEGLIFATHESIKTALSSRDKSNGTETESSSKRLPITWTFHEGLVFGTHESVKSALVSRDKSNDTGTEVSPKRLPISWTFHEGLTLGTHESVKSALVSRDDGNGTETEASSRRLPITWTFYDGLSLGTDSKVSNTPKTAPDNGEIAAESKSKRTVGWTFNDGVVIRNVAGTSPNDPSDRVLVTTPRKRRRIQTTSPADGAEETAGETAGDAGGEVGETAEEAEDAAGEAGEGVEAPEVDGIEEAAEDVAQETPVDDSVLKGLEVGEGGETPAAEGEVVGNIEQGHLANLVRKTIEEKYFVTTGGGVSGEDCRLRLNQVSVSRSARRRSA